MNEAIKFDYLIEVAFLKTTFFLLRGHGLGTLALHTERKGIEAKFWSLCSDVAKAQNLCLYDLDYLPSQHLLRVFVMDEKTQTAVIEDCVKVDNALDEHLEEDWVPEVLTVEVSSPGLFRKLREPRHFEWSLGKRISVVILGNLETEDIKLKKQKSFLGELLGLSKEGVTLRLEPKKTEVFIPYEKIKKAGWEPTF